jgi:SNF2 family DNA or RNA helicase
VTIRKEECLDLPEKQYVRRPVNLTPDQKRHYERMKSDMLAELDDGTVVEAADAIVRMGKLQQITCGQLIDAEGEIHDLPTNRLAVTRDVIEESGGRAIVWCRFRRDITRLEEFLGAQFRVGTYFGDTPSDERRRLVQPGAVDVLVANPASAGTGLNLTHFDTCIYYSNSFSASDRWQSEDRIHRIGQKNRCLYVDLVGRGTIDHAILASLSRKRDTADLLRSPIDMLRAVVAT